MSFWDMLWCLGPLEFGIRRPRVSIISRQDFGLCLLRPWSLVCFFHGELQLVEGQYREWWCHSGRCLGLSLCHQL